MDGGIVELFRRCVLMNQPPEAWLRCVIAGLPPEDEASLMTLLRVAHVISWGSRAHALRHLSRTHGEALPVALAMYALLTLPEADAPPAWLPHEAAVLMQWVLDTRQGNRPAGL